jgi:predicted AAA+ superfamily ATPase
MDISAGDVPTGFVAFASGIPALTETLETATQNITHSGVADLITWQSLQVGGRLLMSTICEAIVQRQLFIADVSALNPNVLFELGFAIAQRKRVWLLLDGTQVRPRSEFDRFQLLTTVGYREFRNSNDVASLFYSDQPYASLDKTVYKDIFELPARHPPSRILYLKSEIETDASIRMSRRISRARFSALVDDPSEMRVQPLAWYARNTSASLGVIAHFLSHEHRNATFHNAKLSLVSGMALGFGKPLLMLAHEPYSSPLDYRDLLKSHATATRCEALTSDWLSQLEDTVTATSNVIGEYQQHLKALTELQQISLGDPVAEQEAEELQEYFIMTATYNEAMRSKHSIVVGRKGTGKTATLYQLAHEISSDKRNHVCIIKPVAYELEGILRMLRQAIPKSEQGYLIESLWKFLIFTELAKSVYEELRSRPTFFESDPQELELLQFMDTNASVLLGEFSVRLESAVASLESLDTHASVESQRLRISELLHADLLPRLRALLGEVLHRKQKVAILVDNLDKAWDQRSDLSVLSQLLFGLLGVSGRISHEFEKSGPWRVPVNVSLILFLRSDIYAQVSVFAKEKDKLPVRFITWEEPGLLLRVIEERFARSSGVVINKPDDIWDRFFCTDVFEIPIKRFITSAVLPRPRDLIYFVRSALDHAVNSGHLRIERGDLLAAEKQYSHYALDSLVVEGGTDVERLEELLYELAGSPEIFDFAVLNRAVLAVGSTQDPAKVADLLVNLTFLGIEVQPGRFEFLLNDIERPKFQSMARRLLEGANPATARYRIARPFHAYLEISRSSLLPFGDD